MRAGSAKAQGIASVRPLLTTSMTPGERIARQAQGHTDTFCLDWRNVFGPAVPFGRLHLVFAAYLARHPMRTSTMKMTALHEAGHYIAFERLGMVATFANIHGSAFGRGGWGGGANAAERPDYHCVVNADRWGFATFWGEAIAALSGPIAEELLGSGDALGSVGELAGAALWVKAAAVLAKQNEGEALRETVRKALSLVEAFEPQIRAIADVLARRKRIDRWQRPVKKILAQVSPGAVGGAAQLSAAGQALLDKIMGALEQFEFLAPAAWAATAGSAAEAGA